MFRGNYQKLGPNGVAVYYGAGDTIIFEGNLYKNINPTIFSPLVEPNSWQYMGLYNLFSRSVPPIKPKLGQLWENGGKIYTYFYDGNNKTWIEF